MAESNALVLQVSRLFPHSILLLTHPGHDLMVLDQLCGKIVAEEKNRELNRDYEEEDGGTSDQAFGWVWRGWK